MLQMPRVQLLSSNLQTLTNQPKGLSNTPFTLQILNFRLNDYILESDLVNNLMQCYKCKLIGLDLQIYVKFCKHDLLCQF
jgi:hypothetical protein